ncbi:hypothetical protein [Sorangium sp. So ce388]|uniref:hypothetical protein n=1 Tax=Sorangium sp. So ce388 TaxID=3133309 RepID=UPI003F5B1DBF
MSPPDPSATLAPEDDPLFESEAVDRAHYAVGVMLDAHDLTLEQTYHRGRLARALAYLHGRGTVAGLRIRYDRALRPITGGGPLAPDQDAAFPGGREEQISVEPGLLVDPLGRLVEVPREACIRLQRWWDAQVAKGAVHNGVLFGAPNDGVVVDVFLRYRAFPRGKTPAFATGPFEALDAVQAARMRDGYELRLFVRSDTLPVPQDPWPDLSSGTLADRQRGLRDAIYNAWRGEREALLDRLAHEPVLPKDQDWIDDPTWTLLARVAVKATAGPAGAPPERATAEPRAVVDNDLRPFAVTAGVLARWVGV